MHKGRLVCAADGRLRLGRVTADHPRPDAGGFGNFGRKRSSLIVAAVTSRASVSHAFIPWANQATGDASLTNVGD